ncbi:MAG: GGDEF domain-containing protein [Alphaproteobacteria bacterium]|jgi:diguanylate cyclase (GGDEF)-like protein|nr:GGDEF domain-containing protein [Alphaproteobacteria bacterium]
MIVADTIPFDRMPQVGLDDMNRVLHKDEHAAIERARQRLAEGAFGEGEEAATVAEILEMFERTLSETARLVQISDRIEAALGDESKTDELTGVFSRRHFEDSVESEYGRSVRFQHPLSILIVDVDHLKRVNACHGHAAGDLALKTLAAAVMGILRKVDLFARVGGQKFVALLPETDTTGAVILAERLREAIARMGIAVGRESVEITVSVGVASLGEGVGTSGELLQMAEQAMETAKEQGRDRVVVASRPQATATQGTTGEK